MRGGQRGRGQDEARCYQDGAEGLHGTSFEGDGRERSHTIETKSTSHRQCMNGRSAPGAEELRPGAGGTGAYTGTASH